MSKPSGWRKLCCTCGHSDDPISDRPYEPPRRRGARSRVRSGKNTWSRSRLLDNEQTNDSHVVPLRCMAYQMRSIETPTNIPVSVDDGDALLKLYKRANGHQSKPPGKDTLSVNSPRFSDDSKTTLPWMDETFNAPSVRSGTRLGISSVKLNARRNSGILNISTDSETTCTESFSSRHSDDNAYLNKPYDGGDFNIIDLTNLEQRSDLTRSKIATSPNSAMPHGRLVPYTGSNADYQNIDLHRTNIPRLQLHTNLDQHTEDHPMILKAPSTNVSIQRLSSGQTRNSNVPKLGDYPGYRANIIQLDNEIPSATKIRPSVLNIFPKTELEDANVEDEHAEQTNVSFASEFSFRKAPGMDENQSVKQETHKVTSSGKKSKYERLKSSSTKSKDKQKPDIKNRAESMYGYVPKLVQDVRASYALEGSTIDDFFKMQQNSREKHCLKRLPYTEEGKFIMLSSESESDNDEIPVLPSIVENGYTINTVVENEDGPVISASENTQLIISKTDKFDEKHATEDHIDHMFDNLRIKTPSETAKPVPGDEKTQWVQNRTGFQNSDLANTKPLNLNGFVKPEVTDENENKVIMIDFPPNLEVDRQVNANVVRKPSDASSDATSTKSIPMYTFTEILY